MKCLPNILDAIGNTPLVHLRKLSAELGIHVCAKLEGLNPGGSAKDRIAKYIIETAEAEGIITPETTIVEATSGNTGFSLAMVAAVKGYRCICTTTDKSSIEKVNQLRVLGAEVEICPASVSSEDPRSYYSRAQAIADSIPGGIYINQYFNLSNQLAHYHTTGPELWKQTDGNMTHFIAPASTGGTISGTARYLKERNKDIKIIAVDAYGSVLTKYFETGEIDPNEAYSYRIEGLGKKLIPGNLDFDLIDEFVKATDEDAAFKARELARKEGIFAGYTSGATISALYKVASKLPKDARVVVMLSDHGSKYLSKIYSDDWMREQGFMPEKKLKPSNGTQTPSKAPQNA
jgi:cystathionine beta-synthase